MRSGSLSTRAVQLAFVAAFLAAWYVVGRTGAVTPLLVPRIEAVADAFLRLVQTDAFWSAVRVTLFTITQAYLIAIVLGILSGYLVTRSRFVTQLMEPMISGLFAIPITL